MTATLTDWRSITDEREKYAAYLCSREWGVLKEAVHERAGGVCERCNRNKIDAVHHLTYARKYRELLTDLAGWCGGCHAFTHGKIDYDPRVIEIRRAKDSFTRLVAGESLDCPACLSQAIKLVGWNLIHTKGLREARLEFLCLDQKCGNKFSFSVGSFSEREHLGQHDFAALGLESDKY